MENTHMKIVVLDGYAANPGDLSWDCVRQYGELTVYDRTDDCDVVSRIGDAQAVIANKTVIDRAVMDACPGLRYIGLTATGYNIIDIEAAAEKGIVVSNVPAYSTDAVSQFTFALLLELVAHVGMHSDTVMAGDWVRSKDFSYTVAPMIELSGKTMGIVGYGNIGRRVASIALAFGMNVLICSRTKKELSGSAIRQVDREELFEKSDVISIHCPLFDDTKNLINRDSIALMKKSALIINTARGGCIDEAALADALNTGRIAGAAVDVVTAEPMTKDNPLLTAKNMIITPHIAWAPRETRARLLEVVGDNLGAFVRGEPRNVIRP